MFKGWEILKLKRFSNGRFSRLEDPQRKKFKNIDFQKLEVFKNFNFPLIKFSTLKIFFFNFEIFFHIEKNVDFNVFRLRKDFPL